MGCLGDYSTFKGKTSLQLASRDHFFLCVCACVRFIQSEILYVVFRRLYATIRGTIFDSHGEINTVQASPLAIYLCPMGVENNEAYTLSSRLSKPPVPHQTGPRHAPVTTRSCTRDPSRPFNVSIG
ncbi:hypothetical protein BaRGS_00002633 [Batillaria attramentaria]|uniref:Uncharacterized protein n=1 Tax=Batillaria attramentaria TaxID=370345 RepID=A0ABD0M329_9CAEN